MPIQFGNRNAHAIPQDGVMNSDLTDLKNACNARGVVSDSVKISEGESLWIIGLPVTADEGQIGLSMGEGHSLIVS
jgi:hypothetical protein